MTTLWDIVHSEDELAAASAALKRHHVAVEDRQQQLINREAHARYQAMLEGVKDWQPPELPELRQFDSVILNFETSGLKWYADDRIISAVLRTPDGVSRYLPIRHEIGPNIPEGQFFEWMRRELRGKKIQNIKTKFDLHMARADGVDLEAQGCTFGDVAHLAALLDDHRIRFNLDLLAKDLLDWDVTDDGLGKLPYGIQHEGQFKKLPAGIVAPYGIRNVDQVARLYEMLEPQIDAEDLRRVLDLESQIIPVVVEMEHNGAPLNVELLERWVKESEEEIKDALYTIKKATGIDLEEGKKGFRRADTIRLFNFLKVPLPLDPEVDPDTLVQKVSFADALIKDIQEPSIQQYRRAAQLKSLRSKFLVKYWKSVQRDGILRYQLHQLPYQEDKQGGGHGGAVSGRFSSASMDRDEGANIQQVFGVESQKKGRPYTAKYLVKELFIPTVGQYVNADASQLQFRFFAHYADDPKIIGAYDRDRDWRGIDQRAAAKRAAGLPLTKDDKLTDFHNVVGDLILQFAHKQLIRTHVKNVNFAQVFGAGVPKMASQLGVPANEIPSPDEWTEAAREKRTHEVGGPKFQEVLALSETYHEMFPSVKPLLAVTAHLAMPGHRVKEQKIGHFIGTPPPGQTRRDPYCSKACRQFYANNYPHRGWVRTYLGRRARFQPGGRFYSALNRVIQGTEGDYLKVVMVAVHERRHELGFTERFTVHDALAGDLQGDPAVFKEVLNEQYLPFKVQILWEVGIGSTWAEAK